MAPTTSATRPSRPWMRRTNSLAVLAGLTAALAGCAPPKRPVYVDLGRALASDPAEFRLALKSPVDAGFASVADQAALAPRPRRNFENTALAVRLASAREQLSEQRAQALESLFEQLFQSYTREVERFRLERNTAIEAELRKDLEASADLIAAALQRYADRRWPSANRLSLLVGYPFPPFAKVPTPGDNRLDQKRYAEIRDLYATLAELERQFEAEVGDIFSKFYSAAATRRLALGVEVVERLNEFEERSRREARQAVAAVNAEIDVTLLDAAKITVPAVPGDSVAVRSPDSPVRDPLASVEPSKDIMSRQDALEADLQIWLGTHRYRRVATPVLGRDETENFIQWRRTFRAGR